MPVICPPLYPDERKSVYGVYFSSFAFGLSDFGMCADRIW
jgi:hypothetical protein